MLRKKFFRWSTRGRPQWLFFIPIIFVNLKIFKCFDESVIQTASNC